MKVPQGATKAYKFRRKDANGQPILNEAEGVEFTVRQVPSEESPALIIKSLNDGSITYTQDGYYHFTINSQDTATMATNQYWYSIWVNAGNGVNTPIKRMADFIVQPVVPKGAE